MNCPNCGYDEVPEAARFCPICGKTVLVERTSSTEISIVQEIERIEGQGQVTGANLGSVSGTVNIGTIQQNIANLVQRTLSAVDEAKQREQYEAEILASAVRTFAQRLWKEATHSRGSGKDAPYMGPLPFDLVDTELFFGRERAVREFLKRLERGGLTVLHGESGVGKTSLLQAGIAPQLIAQGHLPVYLRPFRDNPAQALKKAFVPARRDTPNLEAASMHDFSRRIADVLGPQTMLFVFFDRFEEFFAHLAQPARTSFIGQLHECLVNPVGTIRWAISLRTEAFGQLAKFRPPIEFPFENEYYLDRLTRAEAEAAVTGPAELRHVIVEPSVVASLLKGLGGDSIAPAQLQLVCQALYEGREIDTKPITQAQFDDLGGVEGILGNYLNRVLEHYLLREQRPIARHVLEALVTSEKDLARRTYRELARELSLDGLDTLLLRDVITGLIDSRLVRIVEVGEHRELRAYELAHQCLANQIEVTQMKRDRKTAQELLADGVRAYKRDRQVLLSAKALERIGSYAELLSLNADDLDLLFHSAEDLRAPLGSFRELAVQHKLTAELADLWIKELKANGSSVAIHLLSTLSDDPTVQSLTQFIKREGQGRPLSLANLSAGQNDALVALTRIKHSEAKSFLDTFTLSGYYLVPANLCPPGTGLRDKEKDQQSELHPAFWMARFPVTNDEWRRFLEDGYRQQNSWREFGHARMRYNTIWRRWKVEPGTEKWPVRGLTWFEAMIYARWLADTKNLPVALPTEAEWVRAAERARESNTPHSYSRSSNPNSAEDMVSYILEWTDTRILTVPGSPGEETERVSGNDLYVVRGRGTDVRADGGYRARRYVQAAAIPRSDTGCRVCLRLLWTGLQTRVDLPPKG